MTPAVLVINRAADTDRLAHFTASAAGLGLAARRIAAFDGHADGADFAAHADLIGPHFWGGTEAKPGAVACFLSHRRAWEVVARDGPALVCEDDFVLAAPPRAPGADLVFANGRMAAWAQAAGGAVALGDVVAGVAARGGPKACGATAAPGGDGYLLTPEGARRLLALTAVQRITCGVDWAMVWNGLGRAPDAVAAAFPELALLRDLVPLDGPGLRAEVLSEPLGHQARGPSTIRHRITRPIAALRQAGPRAGGGR